VPKLHVIEGPQKGQTMEFNGDTAFVGRSSTNDLQIFDSSISRKHIKLFRLENLVFVEDLKSTNRTLVNDEPIEPGEGVQVGEGDIISFSSGRNFRRRSYRNKGLGAPPNQERPGYRDSSHRGTSFADAQRIGIDL
jgi:pSer/pThr/pTyr-binding forkhead associated (FHA) protein